MARKNQNKKIFRTLSGFTLVELIVVVTILAILATVGFLALTGYTGDAQTASNRTNVKQVYQAISLESTKNGDSPRKYVVYQTGAALSGATFSGIVLSGGTYGTPGTNYTAGTPDWSALRLPASRFQVALRAIVPEVSAASDPYVGALDVTETLPSGKTRAKGYFQVAGVGSDGKTYVEGDFPSLSGSVAGLVKDPSSTGALADSATAAVPVTVPFVATGGTVSTYVSGGINYKIHVFAAVGTGTFQVLSGNAAVDYLVVGGGGGGGGCNGSAGGGGGGGGVVIGTMSVSSGSYALAVGNGGGGGSATGNGTAGSSSVFTGSTVVTAYGGGYGGAGGNAGGAGANGGGAGAGSATAGTAIQGNPGGTGNLGPSYPAAGGGGSTSGTDCADVNYTINGNGRGTAQAIGGCGFHGTVSAITNTSVQYGPGGGGGAEHMTAWPGAAGGGGGNTGGGGGGAFNSSNQVNGNPATGYGAGGGGGAYTQNVSPYNGTGGAGGSGIIVIRYAY